LNRNGGSTLLFDAFSSREPASTSLENALNLQHLPIFAPVTSGAIAVFWQDSSKGSAREPARGAKIARSFPGGTDHE
jgi:hypothetical protein